MIQRVIFPAGSHGKLGGKAQACSWPGTSWSHLKNILPMPFPIKTPKTWYITTDALTEFIHYNNLEELYELKYKNIQEIGPIYPNIIQLMKNSRFPPGIIKSLAMGLDDFGDTP